MCQWPDLESGTSDVNKPLLLLPNLLAGIILALKSRQDLPETASLWRSGKLDELKNALCPLKVVQVNNKNLSFTRSSGSSVLIIA